MNDRFAMMARNFELFKNLQNEDVQKIFAHGKTMTVPKGQTIFFEGTTGNQMFAVLGGKVSLFERKKHLADLTAGAMFGEMALISNEPRSATAIAAEDSYVFVLDETIFQKLLTKRVAVQMLLNIIASLAKRLRAANKKLGAAPVLEQQ